MAASRKIVDECPPACDNSCIDCLQTFRNGHYHKHLDRKVAVAMLDAWSDRLVHEHRVPATHPVPIGGGAGEHPTNDGEAKLKHLLGAAGFFGGAYQHQIRFTEPVALTSIGSTTPDVYFPGDDEDEDDMGVCIYLDGMSEGLHGDPSVAAG